MSEPAAEMVHNPRYGVLLMAYGGPDSLDQLEPYLLDVRHGRPIPADLLDEVRHRYALIGRRSPLLDITRAQAQVLEARLNREAARYQVYVGMRHWYPYIREAVATLAADGIRRVVALCMAPHYSRMSIGAYFQQLQEAQEAQGIELDISAVQSWHAHALFIQALAERVQVGLSRFGDAARSVQVLFTAHSLPAALKEQGDPYDAQLRETAALVAGHLGLDANCWQFCYQSAGAQNTKWLGPPVEEVVQAAAAAGQKQILVAPIGFVADHVEVLYDIDIEARALAAAHGARLERTESLNTSPTFIDALASIIGQAAERWHVSQDGEVIG